MSPLGTYSTYLEDANAAKKPATQARRKNNGTSSRSTPWKLPHKRSSPEKIDMRRVRFPAWKVAGLHVLRAGNNSPLSIGLIDKKQFSLIQRFQLWAFNLHNPCEHEQLLGMQRTGGSSHAEFPRSFLQTVASKPADEHDACCEVKLYSSETITQVPSTNCWG